MCSGLITVEYYVPGRPKIERCRILRNRTGANEAVYVANAEIEIENSAISGNKSSFFLEEVLGCFVWGNPVLFSFVHI